MSNWFTGALSSVYGVVQSKPDMPPVQRGFDIGCRCPHCYTVITKTGKCGKCKATVGVGYNA